MFERLNRRHANRSVLDGQFSIQILISIIEIFMFDQVITVKLLGFPE